jgi:hypothetical protein
MCIKLEIKPSLHFGRKTLIKRPRGKAWLSLEGSTNMHLLGIEWESVNYS